MNVFGLRVYKRTRSEFENNVQRHWKYVLGIGSSSIRFRVLRSVLTPQEMHGARREMIAKPPIRLYETQIPKHAGPFPSSFGGPHTHKDLSLTFGVIPESLNPRPNP